MSLAEKMYVYNSMNFYTERKNKMAKHMKNLENIRQGKIKRLRLGAIV